jgi:hypothetical protein
VEFIEPGGKTDSFRSASGSIVLRIEEQDNRLAIKLTQFHRLSTITWKRKIRRFVTIVKHGPFWPSFGPYLTLE